jgi:glycosyltransferase involved in cell wall biosynthesis
MKVLQLVTKRQFRGAEIFAANLSAELIKKGHSISFVGIYEPPAEPLSVDGAQNKDLNGKRKFLSLSLVLALSKFIKETNPQIIQANGSDTLKYAIAARIVSRKNVPVVYRNISMVSAWHGNSFFKKRFYQYLFSKVDFITSVGNESINDLIKTFNYPRPRTKVIRRGIPLIAVDKSAAKIEVRRMLDFPANTRLIAHAGNFSEEKNQDFLLDVFHILKNNNPDLKLILIGEGKRYSIIGNKIKALGLEQNVFQIGFRKNIEMFLSASDIFVLSSKVEGIPGVVLEAAAQCTPAIAVNVGGVSEVIVDGQTGVMLSDFDAKAFASELTSLLHDEPRLALLGKNAYNFVSENFHTGKNTDAFITLYDDLITRQSKSQKKQ